MNFKNYVGPENRHDYVELSQVSLLHHFGLSADTRLLDIGCSSLSMIRSIITILGKNFHGLESRKEFTHEGSGHFFGDRDIASKLANFSRPKVKYGFSSNYKYKLFPIRK